MPDNKRGLEGDDWLFFGLLAVALLYKLDEVIAVLQQILEKM